ncbi:MAG TPA: hypothetical protein ENI31_02475 [Candidatus Omnitrophica bacterium]|nr:MAG: hypothetical protein DRP61_05590 [Candidatus Omnitrophota bacterium]RKY34776.1 MAG: hypothetical protein DRP69_03760 [Candidatus Omnitrophota bacterium]RKY44550.1 MAG: hypothetical protein DRP80_01755 [Candidatus Omnitrophota bacterium]HEC69137.1 hypothetical protein [Candidatus Omnitrophota bacterium]
MKKKGVGLILVFLIITILALFSTALLTRTISENNLAKRYQQSLKAFWLAEAGVQKALWELNYGDWSEWDTDEEGNKVLASYPLGGWGEFSVSVSGVGTNQPTITSSGHIPTVSESNISRSLLVKTAPQTQPLFTHAGFGNTSLTMSGNGKTDSYDSSLGPYGGDNIGSNGDVGTNGTSAGAITLSGNAQVNGDAGTGEGGTVSISGNAEVSGEITDNINRELPLVSSMDGYTSAQSLTDKGSYSLSGNSSDTISESGKYDSISLSANSKLYIEGDVVLYTTSSSTALNITGNAQIIINSGSSLTIYTDGKCQIAGNGIVNNTTTPSNLQIYSTYSGSSNGVKVSGNGDLYGAIYAPETEVKITGNGDIYGSVVGDTVKVTGNGDLHYDEALANITTSSGKYTIEVWQDQQNPYSL